MPGANIDAIEVAGRFGIRADRAVNYENDSEGVRLNYDVMSKAMSCAMKAESDVEMEKMFEESRILEPIRADYQKRHQKKKNTADSGDRSDARRADR